MLHCMCSGPSGSVKILKWLFETMPHLKSPQPKGPDILNLGSKVNIAYDYQQERMIKRRNDQSDCSLQSCALAISNCL